jgi:CBS domain containing-hemolysin-like protein
MTGTAALLIELLLVGLMAVLSAAEAALRSVRRSGLRFIGPLPKPAAELGDPANRALAAVVIADFFTTFALAAIAAAYLAPGLTDVLSVLGLSPIASGVSAVISTVVVVSILAIVLGVFVPRAIATRHPTGTLRYLAWPIRLVSLVLAPIVVVLFGLTRVLARPFGASPEAAALVTEEELKALVETGEEQGVIEEEERELIHSVFSFGEKLVHEVMVPRTDIVALDVETPMREVMEIVMRSGRSRIPVYQHNPDDVIGILYVKDLLREIARGRFDGQLRELLRPAHFVPETKKVAELLREMQQQKVHLAIVVDEYGGTSGLVTIEDLVEEIVGEIRDEFETDEERVIPVSAEEAVMDGRVPFEDVKELFALDVPSSEEYDTLAGFIVHELGRMPRAGDVVRVADVTFTVEDVQARRARRIRVRRQTGAPTTPPR